MRPGMQMIHEVTEKRGLVVVLELLLADLQHVQGLFRVETAVANETPRTEIAL